MEITFITSYEETRGPRGVGFYVRGEAAKRIYEVKGINEKIGVLKLDCGKNGR